MDEEQVSGTEAEALSSPEMLSALSRLLDRIDRLEGAVDKLTTAVEQAPGIVAMVTDTVDDAYAQAAREGIDLDERMRTALGFAEKLTSPEMAARLDQLLILAEQGPGIAAMVTDTVDDAYGQALAQGIDIDARLRAALELAEKLTSPTMMTQLNQLLALAEQAPGIAAMVADTVDDAYAQASSHGVDIDGRLRAGLEMAEKLTAPEMVEKINTAIELADQGPGIMAMMVDIIDDVYIQAIRQGFNPEQFVRQGVVVTSRMAELLESGEINALLQSGVIDPKAVDVVGTAAKALVTSRAEPAPKMGIFGMLKAMRDPDLQRALGFLTVFGKNFGENLDSNNGAGHQAYSH